jgi:hypothetical protein
MGESDDEPVTRYLLFTKAIDQPEQAVWIGDVDGSKMHRLTRGVYGLVSPDGTKIAVSRRAGVFTVNPDGGGEDFIARGRPAEWLPDSRHLLATQGRRAREHRRRRRQCRRHRPPEGRHVEDLA